MEESQGLGRIEGAVVSDGEISAMLDTFRSSVPDIEGTLEAMGLPIAETRVSSGSRPFPSIDLKTLGSGGTDDYEDAYNELLHWNGMIHFRIATAKNDLLGAQNALKVAKGMVRKECYKLYHRKVIRTQDELEAHVDSHPHVQDAVFREQVEQQKLNLLEAFRVRVANGLQAVSRHITLRGQDLAARFSTPQGATGPAQSPWARPPR